MMWGLGHDYEIENMNNTGFLRWVGANDFDRYWSYEKNSEDVLSYIHPVQGDHCFNMNLIKLYDKIVEDYKLSR
jgi:hypothetical protein